MISSYDYYKQIESPNMYLCNPDRRFICALNGENRHLVLRFNDLSELTFTVPKLKDTETYYNLIESKRLIFIEKIGWFQIVDVSETTEGDSSSKDVTAQSHQYSFKDRGFVTEERLYMFYNPNDPLDEKYDSSNALAIPSVVGQLYQQLGVKVLLNNADTEPTEDKGDWTIIYIDPILKFHSKSYGEMYVAAEHIDNVCRGFEAKDDLNGYDFMINQVEKAFEVIFEFDILRHTIKVKILDDITKPTNIYLAFDNLVTSLNIKESAEDIVTVMSCNGSDIDIRTVNPMGTNYIANFDYYKKRKSDDGKIDYPWMSKELIAALDAWEVEFEKWQHDDDERTGHTKSYSTLVKELQELYMQKTQADADIQYANLKLTDMQVARDQYINGDDKTLEGEGYVTAETVNVDGKSLLPASNFYGTNFTDIVTITGHTTGAKPTKGEDGRYTFSFDDAGVSGTPKTLIQNFIDSKGDEDNASVAWYFMDGDNRSYCKLNVASEVGVVKDEDGNISTNGTVEVRGVTMRVVNTNSAFAITFPDGTSTSASQSNSYFIYDGARYRILASADGIVSVYAFYVSGFDRYTTYAETVGDSGWCSIWENHINRTLTPISNNLQNDIEVIEGEMTYINTQCNIQQFIKRRGQELYDELSNYWIEGDYSNGNIATYDTTTMSERIDLAKELMNAGKVDLAKCSQPQFEMTVDALNFIKMYEFRQFTNELVLGRIITIEKCEGVCFRPALMTIEYDLDVSDSFSMTFSNASKPGDTSMTFADLLKETSSATRTVSANWSNLTDYSRNKEKLTSMINAPLDRTLRAAQADMAAQAFIIDDTGILGRKYDAEADASNGTFLPEQIRIINNTILFTDDNWESASLALGKIYGEDGEYLGYGLAADVLIGTLLIGETLEIKNAANTIMLDDHGIAINKKIYDENSDNFTLQRVFEASTDGNLYVVGEIYATKLTLADGVYIEYKSISDTPDLSRFVVTENGYMRTNDYSYGGSGAYANAGMCINFADQFIRSKNFALDASGDINVRGGNIGELIVETKDGSRYETTKFTGTKTIQVTIPRGTIGFNDGVGVWNMFAYIGSFSLEDLGITDTEGVIMGEFSIAPFGTTFQGMEIVGYTDSGIEVSAWVKNKATSLTMDTTVSADVEFSYYRQSSAPTQYSLIYTKDNTFNISSANNTSVLTITNTRMQRADISSINVADAHIAGITIEGGALTYDGLTLDFSDSGYDNYSAKIGFTGTTIMVYIDGSPLPCNKTFDVEYTDAGTPFKKTTSVTVLAGTNMNKVELPILDNVTDAAFVGGAKYFNFTMGESSYDRYIGIRGGGLCGLGSYNSTYSCFVGGSLGTINDRWSGLYTLNIGSAKSSYQDGRVRNIYAETIRVENLYNQDGEAITGSDRNIKNSIEYLSDNPVAFSEFFDALKPVTFKYNDGKSGRRHIGFIAQDVKDSMEENNISQSDLAIYCSWMSIDDEGNEVEVCGLRYGEFIPLAIHEIQALKQKVATLETELKELKGELNEA